MAANAVFAILAIYTGNAAFTLYFIPCTLCLEPCPLYLNTLSRLSCHLIRTCSVFRSHFLRTISGIKAYKLRVSVLAEQCKGDKKLVIFREKSLTGWMIKHT